jgi:D-alanyl-D-alanine carboxypeptidase/D-alanyl-D-alanine-endopeptidase (penicillin-binding protein 4)
MKSFLFVAVILLLVPCLVLASPPQAERLTQQLTELLPHEARWGLTVLDLKSGTEIIKSENTNELLSPASLVKLITAGAALDLEINGKHIAIATEILHDGRVEGSTLNGNIYLRGNGNCLLTADDLKKAAQILRGKGIQKVMGEIVADESRFDTRGLERTLKRTGHTPAGALGLDLHTVSVIVTPGEPGKQPVVTVEPPNASARFAVAARTITGGRNSIEVAQIDDSSYRVSGDIPRDSAPFRWRFPLSDPALIAGQSFSTILTEAGIKVSGDTKERKTPADAIALATIPGPTMTKMVSEMNMNSLNVVADNLLLALGADSEGSPGTREKGLSELRGHLERHGISTKEMTVADGSGLLPGNRVTTRAMARYLASAAKQSWYPTLYQSLPKSGMDGTLRNSSFKNERFRAKSGSMENVVSLAGYGVDKSGREVAFAFIANSSGPLPPNARSAGDMVMQFLSDEVLQ